MEKENGASWLQVLKALGIFFIGIAAVIVALYIVGSRPKDVPAPAATTSVVTSVTNTVVVVHEVEKEEKIKKEEVTQEPIKGVETNGVIEFRKIKTKLKFD
jgi:peptidoglycan/LPS O-acetylase OafA/YrhL